MSTNLRVDTSMDLDSEQAERRRALLAKRAEMEAKRLELAHFDAELASLLPSSSQTSHHHHRSPINKQNRRNSNVPRSMSSHGVPAMSRHLSADRNEMSKRPKALSQRSATSMARVNSRGNTSQRMPFTQNGAIPPPLNSEPRRENAAIMDWGITHEQPLTAYTFSHQDAPFQQTTTQRSSGLEQVPELDLGENPGDYLSRTIGSSALSPSTSNPSSTTLNNHRLSTGSFNMLTPSTPTTDSLTTATTLASDMSRQNSLCNGFESMQMKLPVNNSFPDSCYDQPMYDQVTQFPSSYHIHRSSDEEQSHLLVGTGGVSHESQFSHSYQYLSSGSRGEKMEKSQSNESVSSSVSSTRSVKRLQDQIAAARPLMPKGYSVGMSMSRENSSQSMARLESKDGLQDKVAISKPTYQRPKHDRVYCDLCENHPDGFRGEHELRRHKDREHKSMVKKFTCVEPTEGGKHLKPVIPLSKCKACTQQKKKYGAYYNAAAHLRRAHFVPKTKGRSKSQPKSDDADKRGGNGGGDYPSMAELKFWMREVEVRADYLAEDQEDPADVSDDETTANTIDDRLYSQQAMTSINTNNFDNSYITDNSPIINIYPATVTLNNPDIYGMSDMPLDLSGAGQQTQCMDHTMFNLPSQNSFPYFSSDLSQNDPLAFLDGHAVPSQSFNDFESWS